MVFLHRTMERKILAVSIMVLLAAVFLLCTPVRGAYVPDRNSMTNLSALWQMYYEQDDEAYSMVQISGEENWFVAGYTKSYGAGGSDMWLVKNVHSIFPLGNTTMYGAEWARFYGGPEDDGARCIVQSVDGEFALAGYTKSYGAGGSDMFLLKVDSSGTALWTCTFGRQMDDAANGMIQDADGGYILAGYTNSNATGQSTWLVKADANGQMMWNQTYPGIAANSIVRTADGGYALAVELPNSFALVKVDSAGQLQWNQTYAGPSDSCESESAVQTSDGGYALAGWTLVNGTGAVSARLVKTDSSGTLEWERIYAGLGAYAVVQISDGGYALTGDRAFLMVTDSEGNVVWNRNYDMLSEEDLYFTRAYTVLEREPNEFFMAGTQESYGYYDRGLTGCFWRTTLRVVDDITPPSIIVLEPDNKVYTSSSVPLTFTIDKFAVWISYSLDSIRNVTISGNTTITGLMDGHHTLSVYAAGAEYYINGASRPVFFQNFVVDTEPLKITANLTQNSVGNGTVSVSYAANKEVSWATYSLDGQENRTIIQDATLTVLSEGKHMLTVYVVDIRGLVGASDTIEFAVEAPTPAPTTPASTPTPLITMMPAPTQSASPSVTVQQEPPSQSQPGIFPAEAVYAAGGMSAVIMGALATALVLRKRKQATSLPP